jgi:hypothetical protein
MKEESRCILEFLSDCCLDINVRECIRALKA